MDSVSFPDRFPTQAACFAHVEAVRWPDGPTCPKCGAVGDALRLPKREGYWMCRACRAQFSVLHGTPMEGTHLPLRKWFGAIFLLVTSSKGVSSMVISRQLGIGYKTAWFLTHRLRAMMEQDWEKLRGIVEADKTYVGGKRRKGKASKRDGGDDQPKGRGGSRKMMATVAVERGGNARVRKGRTHSERTIAAFVYDVVDRSAVLSTDDLPAYRWIGRKFAAHLRVNHSADEFVRIDPHAAATDHVNTAESFNATLKRAVIGVWHWFSIKHADRYLDEVAFRWNHRGGDASARLHDMFRTRGRRIRFRELVA